MLFNNWEPSSIHQRLKELQESKEFYNHQHRSKLEVLEDEERKLYLMLELIQLAEKRQCTI